MFGTHTHKAPAQDVGPGDEALERIARLESLVEALPHQLHAVWSRDLERVQAECVAHVETVAARLEALAEKGMPRRTDPEGPSALTETFYAALEARFRGSRDEIGRRQESYLADIEAVTAKGLVLDLGCGRGEFLRVLAHHGVDVVGVDASEMAIAECTAAGLDAQVGDLRDALASRADASVRVVAMLQVVEHLPFEVLLEVLGQARRVLRPGGLLLLETPNGANVTVAASTFWLDPSHVRPLHPLLLSFVVEQAGFSVTELRGSSPSSPAWALPEDDPSGSPMADAIRGIQSMLVGDQDMTLLAHVPS